MGDSDLYLFSFAVSYLDPHAESGRRNPPPPDADGCFRFPHHLDGHSYPHLYPPAAARIDGR